MTEGTDMGKYILTLVFFLASFSLVNQTLAQTTIEEFDTTIAIKFAIFSANYRCDKVAEIKHVGQSGLLIACPSRNNIFTNYYWLTKTRGTIQEVCMVDRTDFVSEVKPRPSFCMPLMSVN